MEGYGYVYDRGYACWGTGQGSGECGQTVTNSYSPKLCFNVTPSPQNGFMTSKKCFGVVPIYTESTREHY